MTIYLIAGPPGIGKSTNGRAFLLPTVSILDEDLAAYQYRKDGFGDFMELASWSVRQRIRTNLFAGEDFALELNLGFQSHYDYLKSIAAFNPANRVHLLLFFTDDRALCLDRARIRHMNGGHEVKPEIVEEMYRQTIPLFLENQRLFASIRLIDVTSTACAEPDQNANPLPNWIIANKLQHFLTPVRRRPKGRQT